MYYSTFFEGNVYSQSDVLLNESTSQVQNVEQNNYFDELMSGNALYTYVCMKLMGYVKSQSYNYIFHMCLYNKTRWLDGTILSLIIISNSRLKLKSSPYPTI